MSPMVRSKLLRAGDGGIKDRLGTILMRFFASLWRLAKKTSYLLK